MMTDGKVSIRRGAMTGRGCGCFVAAVLAMSCGAAGASQGPMPISGAPAFDPITFFAGATQGHGRLRVLWHRVQPVEVRGRGVVSGSAITLDQDVTRAGHPTQHRTWRLHRTGPGRYAGTLSDAVGPVSAQARDNALHISFNAKGGLRIEQCLTLQPGGQSALNVMTVRKFGVVVAHLNELIVRLD